MPYGYISMRNEDGTDYLSSFHIDEYTYDFGKSENDIIKVKLPKPKIRYQFFYDERKIFPYSVYKRLEKIADETRKNDNPDNGFFGIYQLKFHPVIISPKLP